MRKLFLLLMASSFSFSVIAQDITFSDLKIKWIRTVGDYSVGDTADGTIELWFDKALALPDNFPCSNKSRIYIDAKHQHIISAAYLAFASDLKVRITVDSNLPVRFDSCEISLLDVFK